MRFLKLALIAFSASLGGAYLTLGLYVNLMPNYSATPVTVPRLMVQQHEDAFVASGSWKTVEGEQSPYDNSVEVRCIRERQICIETSALALTHDVGVDIEAHGYLLDVRSWTPERIEAVGPMDECHTRHLVVQLRDQTATLSWAPTETCAGDAGRAVLIGDPA